MTKHYAKKRAPVEAAQWRGEMSPDVTAVLELRTSHVKVGDNQALEFAGHRWPGRIARLGDWICATPDGDLILVGDEEFRATYEEVDMTGSTLPPTDEEHEANARDFVKELDALLVAGLKLSREEHTAIFRERDRLLSRLRHLFDDERYNAARRERHRIRNKIAQELTP